MKLLLSRGSWHATLMMSVLALPVAAQTQRRASDSIPVPGSITQTESALYAAVRERPRDPNARLALGRYLVARGATRVGMTLLEEAIRFGAESSKVEPDLARAYLEAGDYRSLAALKSAAAGQRQRARWFLDHESRTIAPDSVVVVPWQHSSDSVGLGVIALRLNGRVVTATISSSVSGIVVSDSIAVLARVQRFPGEADRGVLLGAADSIGIGNLSVTNVPVTISRAGSRELVIGLDVIGQFVPVFDPATQRVTLHVGGPVVILPLKTRFVTWRATSELQLLESNGWISIARPSVGRVLRSHRWMFDSRRGMLVIEP